MSKPLSHHFSGTIGARNFDNQKKKNRKRSHYINNRVVNSVRSGSALKEDPQHNFPSIVDNYASSGRRFHITGGDGIKRTLYQVEGSYNGRPGIFEWIIEGFLCTHRRFIENGKITGKPNQSPERRI